jgi:hypothetical protein
MFVSSGKETIYTDTTYLGNVASIELQGLYKVSVRLACVLYMYSTYQRT